MSAVNDGDDLLNYELGDDIDDQDICDDEDELLLSDEELDKKSSLDGSKLSSHDGTIGRVNKRHIDIKKLNLKNETEDVSIHKYKKPEEVSSSACESEGVRDDIISIKHSSQGFSDDVSTSGESPPRIQINDIIETYEGPANAEQLTVNDEVSSTNKEIEESPSQSVVRNVVNESILDLIPSSQESISITGTETSDPREDDDEMEERYNIKHTNERYEGLPEFLPGVPPQQRFYLQKRGRGGGFMRTGVFQPPRQLVRYPQNQFNTFSHPNENKITQVGQFPIPYSPTNPQMNPVRPFNVLGCTPNGVRLEYRPSPIGNFRGPNEFPMYAPGPRPEFVPPGHVNNMPYNNYTPQGQIRPMFRGEAPIIHGIRPRLPIPPRPLGMPQHQSGSNFRNGTGPPMNVTSHPQGSQMPVIRGPSPTALNQPPTQQIIPSKILINPNFKGGGLQAATNQLLKDSHFINVLGNQVTHLHNDNDLLRQQEEFINKNREHIKRRHERSPPLLRTRSRSRSRERSYSPSKRDRARRANSREQYMNTRGRARRANSREYGNRNNYSKKRRSSSISPERRKDRNNVVEEDEETRAYRIKIEKQKALREKFMREKEMRRRKAVETKLQHEEKCNTVEQTSPTKLEPISVTNKIIRLKRDESNATAMDHSNASELQTVQRLQKTVAVAVKSLPEPKRSANTATAQRPIQKSYVKKTQLQLEEDFVNKNNHHGNDDDKYYDNDDDEDDDDIDEDFCDNDELLEEERLLADTPSPPPSPKTKSPLSAPNRRIVIKPSLKEKSKMSASMLDDNKKGIFHRLERKVAVKEADKRKIQRIIIKNAE